MKENIIFEQLTLKDSPYYAGSACLLALSAILHSMKKEVISFDEAFPEIEEKVSRLMEEDGTYFFLSSKKEPLSSEDWTQVISITEDYAYVLDTLNEMMEFVTETMMNRYLPLLKEKFLILANLCRISLSVFYDQPNPPEEFFPVANAALLAIRG